MKHATEYKAQEEIVLTDNVNVGEVLPVGTTGIVTTPGLASECVGCKIPGVPYDCTISVLSIDSLKTEGGRRFSNLDYARVPGRQDWDGSWIIKLGRPLCIVLRDGRSVSGTPDSSVGNKHTRPDKIRISGEWIFCNDIAELTWSSEFRR